jgi:hypothetical protein
LARRGITSTAAGLALVLETHAVTATPTAIAEGIARGARGVVRPSDSPSVTSPPGRLRWSNSCVCRCDTRTLQPNRQGVNDAVGQVSSKCRGISRRRQCEPARQTYIA